MNNDEREGLPSASSLERYSLCPGSWNAIQRLSPEERDTSSADSDEGTKRHALIEAGDESKAEDEAQEYVVRRCSELVEQAKQEVFGSFNDRAEFKEKRLWLHDENFNLVMSGRLDVFFVGMSFCKDEAEVSALIVDYKTMYGDSGYAANNLQTRAYAVLLAARCKLDSVYVALIQPMLAVEKQLTMTYYDSDALDKARAEIFKILKDIKDPFAPRLPSLKACKYCPAKLRCPEAQAAAFALVSEPQDLLPDRPVTPEELEQICMAEKLLGDLSAARKAAAMAQLEADPESLPGWTLKPGSKSTKITNPSEAWERVGTAIGGPAFSEACTISIPKLVKPYQEVKGLASQAASRKEIEALLADAIETKEGAPVLARV